MRGCEGGGSESTIFLSGGERTYSDVGSVEWRLESVGGGIRASAFEGDDGAGLAGRGLRRCGEGEREGV